METLLFSGTRVFLKFLPAVFLFLILSAPLISKHNPELSTSQDIQAQPIVQIPFRISSGLIMIPIRINDSRELSMYLDTGMSAAVVVLFHKELIEEIKLTDTQNILLRGAGGGEQKAGTLAPGARVRLGGLEMSDQTVVIFDESRETSEWQIDGIIGRTLFDNYLAQIDYEKSTLSLYAPAETRLDSSLHPIPINFNAGIPLIETKVSIDGQNDRRVGLVVDLGHRNALVLYLNDEKGIRAPANTIRSLAGRGIQGEVVSQVGRLHEIELGPYSLKGIPTSFLDPGTNMGLSKDIIDGDLGQLILNRFNVILDYRHKQMFLSPNRYFHKPQEYDMSGMILEQNRDGFYYVRYIVENSPAAESNIAKGDILVELNGKDIRDYEYGEVFDLLRQDGQEVRITFERENQQFTKILKLRRLI